MNDRYQKGVEMLGSGVLVVRLGGIHTLQGLAKDHPEDYHVQIMRLLCAFARHSATDESWEAKPTTEGESSPTAPRVREDIKAVVEAIRSRDQARVEIEKGVEFKIDLRGVHLSGAEIPEVNLSSAILQYTDLSRAQLPNADLAGAFLVSANLSGANLTGASLSGAELPGANLSGVNLPNANLSGADLFFAVLADANLAGTNLSRALLDFADLSGANLLNADLSSANLLDTNLSGALLDGTNRIHTLPSLAPMPVRGLTQAQLDGAHADPGNPPKIDGVLDAETGEPLVWRSKPLTDGS